MSSSNIYDKSYNFAISIIKLYKHIVKTYNEYTLSKQLLKSGTSIGANIREAKNAQSKKDFLSKMNIALKEATETEYWLELLRDTNYISNSNSLTILDECIEIKKILTSIVKTTKKNLET